MRRGADTRRLDIEGLRGLAILLVVAYHARLPMAAGGFVGVDIFFVISGYLIAGQLAREHARTGRVDLLDFYARRARRLLPAAALVILTTIAAARLLLSPLEQADFTASAIAATLYVANLWFAAQSTDYLAAPPETNPLLHTWSLSVEEQFYVAWPVLLVLAWRTRLALAAVVTTAAVTAVSTGALLDLNDRHHAWAFFGPHTRAWEFGIGALAALLPWRLPHRAIAPASLIGLAAMIAAGIVYDARTPFPGVSTAVPVAGAALVLLTAHPLTTAVLSWLRHIGRVSYSWYLWHWPVVVFAATLVPGLSPAGRAAASILALGLAWVAQVVVEDRIRFSSALRPRPALTLALAAALTAGTLGTAAVWRLALGSEVNSPALAAFQRMREDHPLIATNGCHLTPDAVEIRECTFGAVSSPTVVVLYGDSHAAQLFPALDALAQARDWRLVTLTKMACPVAAISRGGACTTWRREATARIRALKPALTVVASSSLYLADEGRLAGASEDAWVTGTRQAMRDLEGIRTVIVSDLPQPGFDPVTCLARKAWHPWLPVDCAFDRTAVRSVARAADLDRRATTDFPHVRTVDLSSAVCDAVRCEPMAHGLVRYRDDNHLTARFAAGLAGPLGAAIDSIAWR